MNFLNNIGAVIFWALLGTGLLLAADHIIDRVDPMGFDSEIKKGNIAAAIVMSALILGVAIIIYGAMLPAPNSPAG